MAMKPSSADTAAKQTKLKKDEKPIRYAEIFKENNIETNKAIARALSENKRKPIKPEPDASAPSEMSHLVQPGICNVCMYVCLPYEPPLHQALDKTSFRVRSREASKSGDW